MSRASTAARNRLRLSARPSALGYLAVTAIYIVIYWPVMLHRFHDGAYLLAASIVAVVIAWHVAVVGRGYRALYLWAVLAPMAGASLGYLAWSLLFLSRHGQFVAGHGFGQWLPNVLIVAGFSARAWILSFMLVVWATVLYVAKPGR